MTRIRKIKFQHKQHTARLTITIESMEDDSYHEVVSDRIKKLIQKTEKWDEC